MKRALLMLAASFLQLSGALAQVPCQAKIDLTWHDQLLVLTGRCRSLLDQPARYSYKMVVLRQSQVGRSQNHQSGEFALPAQQAVVLTEVRLNANHQGVYLARLVIFDLNGRTIAQDSVRQSWP